MGKIIKWLFYFSALAAVALIIFAYIGPFLGFDFNPKQKIINIPVNSKICVDLYAQNSRYSPTNLPDMHLKLCPQPLESGKKRTKPSCRAVLKLPGIAPKIKTAR